MHHLTAPEFLGLLAVVLLAAQLGAEAARRIGQPAVLGQLVAGVLLGKSALGWWDPHQETWHLLAEFGVVILLFEIGLETDLKQLLRVGGEAMAVAFVGVVLPLALGYGVCAAVQTTSVVAVFVGAALTATSVGITARVLSELGRLRDPEGQIILGAAILDDVIGLVILAVVTGLADGANLSPIGVASIAAVAFGFLIVTLIVGRFVVPWIGAALARVTSPGTAVTAGLVAAAALAWLADYTGSALIIGSFAAGLLLRETPQHAQIEHGVANVGHFFVPIFFAGVGAAVDLSVFNPLLPNGGATLGLGALLIAVAIVGKFAAGYAPWWFRGRKAVIGAGMIPRGEVGLIFAQLGAAKGVLDERLFGAVTLTVIVTTFLAPPLLKALLPARPQTSPTSSEGIEELVAGATKD